MKHRTASIIASLVGTAVLALASPAHAADGTFSFTDNSGTLQKLTNPGKGQCINVRIRGVAENMTDKLAMVFSRGGCFAEDHHVLIPSGQRQDVGEANSVKFS